MSFDRRGTVIKRRRNNNGKSTAGREGRIERIFGYSPVIKVMSYAKNEGGFYYIEVSPIAEYKSFRTRNADEKSGIERVVGQRADGSWDTVKWLVGKELAHVENGKLVADNDDARELFDCLDSAPKHIEGNRFEAKNIK